MEIVLLYREYPQKTRNFYIFSVLFPESKLGRFSGMVPETLRISSQGILGRCDKNPIPSICKCQDWYDSICSTQ